MNYAKFSYFQLRWCPFLAQNILFFEDLHELEQVKKKCENAPNLFGPPHPSVKFHTFFFLFWLRTSLTRNSSCNSSNYQQCCQSNQNCFWWCWWTTNCVQKRSKRKAHQIWILNIKIKIRVQFAKFETKKNDSFLLNLYIINSSFWSNYILIFVNFF